MVEYNPMTGQRTDLDVTKEDGPAADATHRRWRATRRAYLRDLLKDCTDDARPPYARELAALGEEP